METRDHDGIWRLRPAVRSHVHVLDISISETFLDRLADCGPDLHSGANHRLLALPNADARRTL
jgi:hypothetical protein